MSVPLTQPQSHWDAHTLRARIESAAAQKRFEAGSPNPEEIDGYRRLIGFGLLRDEPSRVLVLGMTPELRIMALAQNAFVTCVDNNPTSIELFRDWTPDAWRERERVIECDWLRLAERVAPFDAILGDGVFGNLPTLEAHRELLSNLRSLLKPGRRMVFRQALVPDDFDFKANEANALLSQFRKGQLSGAEFGFAMRLWGCFGEAYDSETRLLDNRVTFERYERMREDGLMTDEEMGAINRYYFGGKNLLMRRSEWEDLLKTQNLCFETLCLQGKHWYEYYPLYQARAK